MSTRHWLTLPSLGLLAAACGTDGTATTNADSTSTGEPAESSTSNDPSLTETTAPADSSSTTMEPVTTTEPADSSSSTGEPMLCGNGDLDEPEECDDENVVDGDECSATCTLPYEIVWTQTHNGSASNGDYIAEVAIGGDGNIYVVGRERVTDEGFNLWLRQYLPDGTEGWTLSYDGLLGGGDDEGSALVVLADGDIVVAGTVEGEFDGDDIFAARIDGTTQAVEWEVLQDGPGMGPGDQDDADSASDIVVDADGNLYVAGSLRVDVQNWDFWIGKYDEDGLELWQQSYAGAAGGADFGRAVAVDGDGVAWLLGNEEDEDGVAIGTALAFDVDGTPLDAETQVFDFRGTDLAIDEAGNIHVLGTAELGATFDDFAVRKYDAAWAELWGADVDINGSNDFSAGLSVGPTGNVYVTGLARAVGPDFDGALRVFDADGNGLWGAQYGNDVDADLDDQFNFAVEHPDGDVIAGGFQSELGEQTNALLIKYRAL